MLFQCHVLSCHIWAVFHVVVLASSWWWKNSFAHPLWRSDKESFRMHILENFLLFTDLMENNAENLNGTFLKLCIYDKSFYFIMSTQLTADIYQVIHLLFKELFFLLFWHFTFYLNKNRIFGAFIRENMHARYHLYAQQHKRDKIIRFDGDN